MHFEDIEQPAQQSCNHINGDQKSVVLSSDEVDGKSDPHGAEKYIIFTTFFVNLSVHVSSSERVRSHCFCLELLLGCLWVIVFVARIFGALVGCRSRA
jgi:hypothetical protein